MERRKGRKKLDRIKMQRRWRRNSAPKGLLKRRGDGGRAVFNIDSDIISSLLLSHAMHTSVKWLPKCKRVSFLHSRFRGE